MGLLLEEIAAGTRTEAQARADVALRRAMLAADMRAEGTPQALVDRLATNDVASRMLDHERRVVEMVNGMFGGAR